MNEKDIKLVVDAGLGRVSKQEFLNQFPTEGVDPKKLSLKLFNEASQMRDSHAVDAALTVGGLFGIPPESQEVLRGLALADWHYMHEDVITTLSRFNDPGSAEVFYQVALKKFPYRDYDEAESLAVKCIWALGELGTDLAIEKLRLLAKSDKVILRENALHQLQRLQAAP